jgi:CO/xanthine dehydrogenase Mo-binding subunit
MPLVWGQAIAGQSILAQTLPEWLRSLLPGWVPGGMKSAMGSLTGGLIGATGQDDTSVEGAKDLAYEVGTLLVEYDFVDPAIPVGFWRSVGHSYNGFVVESFVDELAHAAKQDPLQYRKALLKDKPRHLRALDLVASKAAWTEKPRQGVFRGIAVHQSFGSVCAQVVELSIENGKTIKLHRIVAAIDCGRAVNPDHVAAQVTSGIVYGLSGALLGDVSIKDGKVEQSNFHDYPVLRMIDTPPIEVHIVPSEAAPSGVGEPGLPPVAAAIGNAVFAATGKRLRKIPLSLS